METYLFDDIVEAVEARIFTTWRADGSQRIWPGGQVTSFGTQMVRWRHQHDDGDQEEGECHFQKLWLGHGDASEFKMMNDGWMAAFRYYPMEKEGVWFMVSVMIDRVVASIETKESLLKYDVTSYQSSD